MSSGVKFSLLIAAGAVLGALATWLPDRLCGTRAQATGDVAVVDSAEVAVYTMFSEGLKVIHDWRRGVTCYETRRGLACLRDLGPAVDLGVDGGARW